MDKSILTLQIFNMYKVACISWEFELNDTLILSNYKILWFGTFSIIGDVIFIPKVPNHVLIFSRDDKTILEFIFCSVNSN